MSDELMTAAVQAAAEDVSRELDSDDVEMWLLVRWLRDRAPQASSDEMARMAGQVVTILSGRAVVVGEYSLVVEGFAPWEDQTSAAREVERRIKALGRDPQMGEIGWLERKHNSVPWHRQET